MVFLFGAPANLCTAQTPTPAQLIQEQVVQTPQAEPECRCARVGQRWTHISADSLACSVLVSKPAGAGSIMTWMGEVVGPTGQVVAVDLDPKFLSEPERPNVTVVQADIRTAQLSQQSFDLVHARYVLIHLPDHEVALAKMLNSLKSGGWLVLEEPDFSGSRGITGGEQELASLRKVNQAIEQMYATLSMDYALGLTLPALMQRRELQYLTVENDATLCAGGSGMAMIMKMSAVQLREKYLAIGVVGPSDLERYCRFADDPNSWAIYYATIAVSGRKVGG